MTPRQVQILIGLGVLIAVLAAVLVVVLVIGWGDPEAAPTSLPTNTGAESTSTSSATATSSVTTTLGPPTTASASTSAMTSTSSTSTTTTTTLPTGACAGPGAGPMEMGGSLSLFLTFGDLDGDGGEDRFLAYEDAGGAFRARVELSYGYAAEAADPVGGAGVTSLTVVDLGGTGRLAVTESSVTSSARLVTFYALRGCDLEVVRKGDGSPAAFLLERSLLELSGVTCTPDGIDVTSAESTGGGDWEVSTVTYFWDGEAGILTAGLGAAAILHSPEDDAAIQSHGDFNC